MVSTPLILKITWIDFLRMAPAFVLMGLCATHFFQPKAPRLQKLDLQQVHPLNLELIPQVGPASALILKNYQGGSLESLKGIGPYKAGLISSYINLSP
jgi:hypothetical protein